MPFDVSAQFIIRENELAAGDLVWIKLSDGTLIYLASSFISFSFNVVREFAPDEVKALFTEATKIARRYEQNPETLQLGITTRYDAPAESQAFLKGERIHAKFWGSSDKIRSALKSLTWKPTGTVADVGSITLAELRAGVTP